MCLQVLLCRQLCKTVHNLVHSWCQPYCLPQGLYLHSYSNWHLLNYTGKPKLDLLHCSSCCFPVIIPVLDTFNSFHHRNSINHALNYLAPSFQTPQINPVGLWKELTSLLHVDNTIEDLHHSIRLAFVQVTSLPNLKWWLCCTMRGTTQVLQWRWTILDQPLKQWRSRAMSMIAAGEKKCDSTRGTKHIWELQGNYDTCYIMRGIYDICFCFPLFIAL